jgi:hypothetical protein
LAVLALQIRAFSRPQTLTSLDRTMPSGNPAMEPENLTFVGGFMLVTGFALAALGGFFFGQVYFCAVNTTTCPLSATGAATQVGFAIPFLVFGSLLIPPGAIFMAAGHIAEHLQPAEASNEESEDESPKSPLRVCVKCGHQVEPKAGYCPNCGNQLSKP